MKFTLVLALPAMALAAATPSTVEKRQLGNLQLPLNVECLLQVANIRQCLPNVGSGPIPIVGNLIPCLLTVPAVVTGALACIELPVKA